MKTRKDRAVMEESTGVQTLEALDFSMARVPSVVDSFFTASPFTSGMRRIE